MKTGNVETWCIFLLFQKKYSVFKKRFSQFFIAKVIINQHCDILTWHSWEKMFGSKQRFSFWHISLSREQSFHKWLPVV